MTRKQIIKSIKGQLILAGYPPKRFRCEVQANHDGLEKGDNWDGTIVPLSVAYSKAKAGQTIHIAVSNRKWLEDVIKVTIPAISHKPGA